MTIMHESAIRNFMTRKGMSFCVPYVGSDELEDIVLLLLLIPHCTLGTSFSVPLSQIVRQSHRMVMVLWLLLPTNAMPKTQCYFPHQQIILYSYLTNNNSIRQKRLIGFKLLFIQFFYQLNFLKILTILLLVVYF